MIGLNPAFELLRQNNLKCEDATEKLVMKRIGAQISQSELLTIFEKGIGGGFGKVYKADPQTLIGWVNQYLNDKNSEKNYLDSALLPVTAPGRESYDWFREANKCYKAFLNGVSEQYFHHCIYDRMMLDDKIKINAYRKYYSKDVDYENEEIKTAKRKVIKDTFTKFREQGFTYVYFIK